MSRGPAGRRQLRGPAAALALSLASSLGASACRCDEGARTNVLKAFPEKYAGVGLELAVTGEHPHVVRAIAGGPASAAGLREGDRVEKIDGASTRGYSLADAVAALRGERGTKVSLVVRRGQGAAVETFVLRRGELARKDTDAGPLDGRRYQRAN